MNQVAELLKSVLMSDEAYARGITKKVADLGSMALSTVYTACDGRNNPSIEVIKTAFLATGDQRLKRLLEPRGWELRPAASVEPTRNAEGEAMDVVVSTGRFVEGLRAALADGRITDRERNKLLALLQEVSKEVLEARAALCKEDERPGLKVAG